MNERPPGFCVKYLHLNLVGASASVDIVSPQWAAGVGVPGNNVCHYYLRYWHLVLHLVLALQRYST